MADMQKINLSAVVTPVLGYAGKGFSAVAQLLAKYPIAEKFNQVKAHSVVKKALDKKELLFALVGLVLVFHGTQFQSLLICAQVVVALLAERVKTSVMDVYKDVQVAREKLAGDAPVEQKESEDDKNKHAKKREAKKAGDKASSDAELKESAEAAKKVLKALDSKLLSNAVIQVLAAALACMLSIHGGVAQKVVIAYSLVKALSSKVDNILEFPGFEDLQTWTSLAIRTALFAVFLPLALIAGPLALALNAATCGAELAVQHGVAFLAEAGKIEKADDVLQSKKAFIATCGLAFVGTMWQVWTWAAGGSVAWYFQVLYLPAVIAEGFLGLL